MTVSPTSSTLESGQTLQLNKTINPSTATEGVQWASSNTSVATVSNSGLITAKNSGTATITLKNSSGTKTATCIIKVQNESPKIYRKELVELLFEQPYSKIDFVVTRLGVERKAASRYLKELEEIGVLKSQKVGRETLYINKELIKILKQ